VKKGHMSIYVMLAGVLLLTISLALFKFEIERKKSLSYRRKAVEKIDERDYRREKVFSDLYKILKEAGHNHNKTSIIQYLKSHSSDIDLDFEGMSLRFIPEKEQLLLIYNHNVHYNRVEYYDFDVAEEGLTFNLLTSDLIGRYDYVY
jgi:hypothetical protein